MAKVTAFLCEDTDQLFRYEADYLKHRRRYLANKKAEAKILTAKNNLRSYFDNLRLSVHSFEDLTNIFTVDYFEHCKNIIELKKKIKVPDYDNTFKALESYMSRHPSELDIIKDSLDLSLTFHRRDEFSFKISNSHACPIGGVQNWCGHDKSKPSGYPGIRGEIKFDCPILEGYAITSGFDVLTKGLNLSNGSGGADTYHYATLSMFSSDWPFLAKQQIIEALSLSSRSSSLFLELKELALTCMPNLDLELCYDLIRDQKLSQKEAYIFVEAVLDKQPSTQILNIFHLASIKDCLPNISNMLDSMIGQELKSEPLPLLSWEL